ncbi:MAG: ribonuclease HII [Pseudomonadota bacterium]|nr:ribonuclease HII [Pseudomonadota bacterium]
MPDFTYEKEVATQGLIFGFDEAGRGPWCGPVVAACVCWPNFKIPSDLALAINDSKKLSAKKREQLFPLIMESGAIIGVGQASASEIDKINILQASFLAMHRAMEVVICQGSKPAYALIDGNKLPNWNIPMRAIIGGDSRSLSIAAASIVAKVTRDHIMTDLAKDYPQYGWEKNAGYGTKDHQQALAQYGITPYHRRSYAPIRKIIESQTSLI